MDAPAAQTDAAARERRRLYEDRWSSYGSNTGIVRLSENLTPEALRRYPVFQDYDDRFLLKIIPDVAVATWKAGAVLFEEGSYLDLAFYIGEGDVDVFLARDLGSSGARPIFDASRVALHPDAPLANGDTARTTFMEQIARQQPQADQSVTYLSAMDFDLPRGERLRLGPGDVFGEIGALNGWPQSVTARTATECTLVQIRLPALREMKKRSRAFADYVDRIYRERTLFAQLKSTPLFAGTDEAFVNTLTEHVALASHAPGEVVSVEGEAVDALYLVRSGFLKLSQRMGEGEMAVSYLSKGMTFGEVELLIDGLDAWQYTITSVGYTELVQIARADFEALVRRYPAIERRLWENTVAKIKDAGYTRKHLDKSALIEFALAKGLVQGNSMLVIDLDVCTRCDDCVRGCQSTHGGRPRFVREGEKFQNFLVARSCYHCEDPVCLIGCPTGAIRRAGVAEVVEIDETLCIGCGNCATKCPYDAIIMHETGTVWPETALPEWLRGRERKVASKCDLCYTAEAGPACVNNCPHACAFRIGSLEDFQQLLGADRDAR